MAGRRVQELDIVGELRVAAAYCVGGEGLDVDGIRGGGKG